MDAIGYILIVTESKSKRGFPQAFPFLWKRKVFAQAFFKKLAVGKAEPYGLDLDLKWATAREELGKQRSVFPGR